MAFPIRDERPTPRTTWATWGLIAVCVVVFAYLQPKPMQGVTHGRDIVSQSRSELQVQHFLDRWALVPCEVTHDRSISDGAACHGYPVDDPGAYTSKNVWLPALSAMFLHENVLHLLGNMLFLWVFGRGLEQRIGWQGVLGLFLAGGLAAFVGYVVVHPESTIPLLGASGAIAALMGAYLIVQPQRRVLSVVYSAGLQVVYLPAWAVLVFFFVSQFFTASGEAVAWEAHVAGMIFGMLVAGLWCWREPKLRPRRESVLGTEAMASEQQVVSNPMPAVDPWPTAPPPRPPH